MGLEGTVANRHALPIRIERHLCATDGAAREGRPKGCVVAEEPCVCNVATLRKIEVGNGTQLCLVACRSSKGMFVLFYSHRGRTTIPRLLTMQRANIVQLRQAHRD